MCSAHSTVHLRFCRVHKRVSSEPLGVSSQPLGTLSLNLITATDAATPATSADNAATAGCGASPEAGSSHASKDYLSHLGEAVKAAVASLVPACVGLPLTVAMVWACCQFYACAMCFWK